MNISALLNQFQEWRKAGAPLVLATVVQTAGSTYAKPGTHMLINGDLGYEGLLSGGCLEGDLAERARPVLADGDAALVVYDMRDQEQDQLWGLGLGCNGMMQVLLQRLDTSNGYEPMTTLASHIGQRISGTYGIQVDGPKAGAWFFAVDGQETGEIVEPVRHALLSQGDVERPQKRENQGKRFLMSPIPRVIRLLVLGAGPDAVPMVQLGQALGWEMVAVDHRPGYVERFARSTSTEPRLCQPGRLADVVNLDRYDAAIVMSHHLATDLAYLGELASSRIPYIGSLGPSARRDTLLEDLGDAAIAVRPRLYAPVGLDIGARGPEPIALSVIAQIQGVLHGAPCHHFHAPT